MQKNPKEMAEQIATASGFERELVKTKLFNFTTYQKKQNSSFQKNEILLSQQDKTGKSNKINPKLKEIQKASKSRSHKLSQKPLVIYIEGDGHAWETSNRLSEDPTPHNPVALKLAVLDATRNRQNEHGPNYEAGNDANIVYLARPCQYTPHDLDKACHPEIWSLLRFSEPVIESMNEAVDKIKQKMNASEIHLVGYSGGAAVAVLIAARRKDVVSLKTVAGDLDHQLMSAFHKTSPLAGSLNPKDFVKKVAHIPQQHYVGTKDKVVPYFIAESFVNEIAKIQPGNAKLSVLSNVSHHEGWEKAWLRVLSR